MKLSLLISLLFLAISEGAHAQTTPGTKASTPPATSPQTAPAPDIPAAARIPDSVKMVRDVPFCTGGGHPLLMDLYMPKVPSAKSVPAVLWIHGGGWSIGTKSNPLLAIELAEKGFVTASTDYRLSGEAKFPAAIEDTKCAVRYLRANAQQYGIDPNRIGVAGSSAGGHLALLIATAPPSAGLEGTGGWAGVSSKVQAVVSWFGPADFSVGPKGFPVGGPSVISFLGGLPEQKPAAYHDASPVAWVAKGDPPLLMFHGELDTTVPFDQSVRMVEAYRKAGVAVTLVPIKNSEHGFKQAGALPISPSYIEIRAQAVAFFQKVLGLPDHPTRER